MIGPPTNLGRLFPPEPLTQGEVHALLAAISTRSNSGVRLRAAVGLLYGSGIRLAEMLALEPRDFDSQACTVRVREGKGRKWRLVGIDPYSAALVDRWLDRRGAIGLSARRRILVTYEAGNAGAPLDPRYVRQALARAGRRAGIAKRVHPHGLRHSLAFHMAQSGVPMTVIQAQLGHSSLATTDRYVQHLMPADVVAALQSRSW